MLSIELKILICFVWAFIVFFITALIIGNKGKAKWFQQRELNILGLTAEVFLVKLYYLGILKQERDMGLLL